ncbi:MAG: Fe(2+) transporter FeoB [Candidatus Omnitrophica bacterium]|nr:Fe(2+) transporter FeoB [Candidatus Omnitrophota bacterium]
MRPELPTAPRTSSALSKIALLGNPNAGKTTLFNTLTGLRHKTANYPGVTVERREGALDLGGGRKVRVFDLPGSYSLLAKSPDEEVVRALLAGEMGEADRPDLGVLVVDASNLERNLYLALQIIDTGLPVVVALSLWDVAAEKGRCPDIQELSSELGVPCVPVIGHRARGTRALVEAVRSKLDAVSAVPGPRPDLRAAALVSPEERYARIEAIMRRVHAAASSAGARRTVSDEIDRWVTHPVWGWVFFVAVMALIFQSIFTWASPLMDLIESGMMALSETSGALLPPGPFRSLVCDGILPGVGNVVIFLPQILLLFFFITFFEDFGYLARAAFVLDRLMRRAGLNGKAFLPLLSSFACAIPGIMATRTIADRKDRLVTILVSPLMSCSARLPVYALLIGAFVPPIPVLGPMDLKGATLLGLYLLSIGAGLCVAAVLRRTMLSGPRSPFVLELPPYRLPHLKTILSLTWERGQVFLANAGSIILAISVVLWFLASHPQDPEIRARHEVLRAQAAASMEAGPELDARRDEIDRSQAGEQLRHSYAGRLGRLIEPVIRPLGFDWKIGVGLVASFAAREVMVSTLAVIYNIEDGGNGSSDLATALREETDPITGRPVHTPLTALSLMVFFVLACQCMSTVAIVRRETNGWRWPIFMIVYMTALAWTASFVVFQIGRRMGWG